jgi:predicted O-methyltransferase YrrM
VSHALNADACAAAVELVRVFEPRRVLELGSGRSTVELASVLTEAEARPLLSLEHDRRYLDQTRRVLEERGLAPRVELRHAPIAPAREGWFLGSWYETAVIADAGSFDFVLIDGPPSRAVGRFMALPLLWSRLDRGALLLLDDANRADYEARWLDLWGRIYREALAIRIFPGFQKGLALLMKRAAVRPSMGPGTLAAYARAGLSPAAQRGAQRLLGRARD